MDQRILTAIADMDRRLGSIDVAELAAASGLSRSRFDCLFRACTGMSPARYLHALRMERARLLLERTFLSIEEAMSQVGAADPGRFSQHFSRYHGVTACAVRLRAATIPPSVFITLHERFVAEVARLGSSDAVPTSQE